MKIHKTDNYSQFKFFDSNRTLSKNTIYESMKAKNFLDTHPVVVTKKGDYYYIIDGQHRFAAAEKLKLPIYYVVKDNLEECHIPLLQNQNRWTYKDWLKHYTVRGYDEYVFVTEMAHRYKLPARILVYCYTGMSNNSFTNFRKGKMKLTRNHIELEKMSAQLKDLTTFITVDLGCSLADRGYYALWKILSTPKYNHAHFLKKCEMLRDKVIDALKYRDMRNIYEKLVLRVYHHGRKDPREKLIQEF